MIIPELIEVWRIARAIGLTTEKTRRTLVKMGVASQVGSGLMVVRREFEASMPAIYRIFVEKYVKGELCSNRGGKRANALKPKRSQSKSIKPKQPVQRRNSRPA